MLTDNLYHPKWPDIPHPEQCQLKVKHKSKGKKSTIRKGRESLYKQDKRCRYCLKEIETLEETTIDQLGIALLGATSLFVCEWVGGIYPSLEWAQYNFGIPVNLSVFGSVVSFLSAIYSFMESDAFGKKV